MSEYLQSRVLHSRFAAESFAAANAVLSDRLGQ